MEAAKQVVMIGLAGLDPDLVYQWKNELVNLNQLMGKGIHGRIRSTVPPNTAPAWSCVLCGKNPGHFGYWDFHYRDSYGYGHPKRVSSRVRDERVDSLYKILSTHGKRVAIINVPVSYPPPEIPNGYSVSSLMTPTLQEEFTYPASLREDIKEMTEEYILDVSTGNLKFSEMDVQGTTERIREMDKQRFDLTRYFLKDKNCDFVLSVVMGVDRTTRLLSQLTSKNQDEHIDDQKYMDALGHHYEFYDERIGEVLDFIDENTSMIVMSDHSLRRLEGTIYLNDWLVQEGYMRLKARPDQLTPLMETDIDWQKTKAWAIGSGGQIYLNVKGREPQGIVDFHDYDKVLDELSEKTIDMTDQEGKQLDIKAYKRKEIHSGEYARFGPDLFIFSEDGRWSMSEFIGSDSVCSYDISTSSTDAGHGIFGFFVMSGPGVPRGGEIARANLLDIAPTVLRLMSGSVPPHMEGKVLTERGTGELEERKRKARERLAKLGYLG